MNNYVYILTDSNRNCLHVGMTDDLQQAASTHRELKGFFSDVCSGMSRLVYYEMLPGSAEAVRRFNEVSRYTRMQKERLIRRRNPNWLDLSRSFPTSSVGLPDTLLVRTPLTINTLIA